MRGWISRWLGSVSTHPSDNPAITVNALASTTIGGTILHIKRSPSQEHRPLMIQNHKQTKVVTSRHHKIVVLQQGDVTLRHHVIDLLVWRAA